MRVRVMRGLELTPRQATAALVGLVTLFAVPDLARLSPNVQLLVLHKGVLLGFAAVGLNLLLRHTRLVSFGHAAFFGTGAYAAAVLATHLDVTSMLGLVLAAAALGTAMAAVVGFLSLRHTGLYFALLTLAFGQLLYAVAQTQPFLGSSDGIPVRPGPENQALFAGAALDPQAYAVLTYYLTGVVVVVGLLVMWRLANSPFGVALSAIGQDRTRARFVGIRVRRYVWLAFVISGLYGGVAGGFYGLVQRHVRPEPVLHFLRSGDILYMAILGGFQTLLGPLVGGVVLVLLRDVGRDLTQYFDALTGVVLLVVVFGFPRGIVGSLRAGSTLRRRGGQLRRDPAVVGDWLAGTGRALRSAAGRAMRSLKVLLFGVG